MRQVSFYHQETGVFTGVTFMANSEAAIAANTPADHLAFDGSWNPRLHRMDVATGVIENLPAAPETPNPAEIARNRIRHLEAEVWPRVQRELSLGYDGAQQRLQAIDDEIASLRPHLTG